jgi:FkbM family methyltransferase
MLVWIFEFYYQFNISDDRIMLGYDFYRLCCIEIHMSLSLLNKTVFQTIGNGLSSSEEILAYTLYIKDILSDALKIRGVYKNHLAIIINLLRSKFPIEVALKKGGRLLLSNRTAILLTVEVEESQRITYDPENDLCVVYRLSNLTHSTLAVRFYGARDNGEIISIFLNNIYDVIQVHGKTVIDIGANICDSSIYFILRQAKNVIAIEPFPKNCEIARKNIEVNKLSNRITLLLAACSARSGYMTIDHDYQGIGACAHRNFAVDITPTLNQIRVLTLEDILNEYTTTSDPILKMDCEGCEYSVILSTSNHVLRRFSNILIEYHDGYSKLKEKLEGAGFNVSATRPRASRIDYMNEFVYNSKPSQSRADYLYDFLNPHWRFTGLISAKRT